MDGGIRLMDRWYSYSEYSYHRLQDGITAETFGHIGVALQAYRDATSLERKVGAADWVRSGWDERFAEAVRSFASFRLTRLLLREWQLTDDEDDAFFDSLGPYSGLSEALRSTRDCERGCLGAAAWAMEHPEFLRALNSVQGYENPVWLPGDLCEPLPPSEVEGHRRAWDVTKP
jgi:hypothetical protein